LFFPSIDVLSRISIAHFGAEIQRQHKIDKPLVEVCRFIGRTGRLPFHLHGRNQKSLVNGSISGAANAPPGLL